MTVSCILLNESNISHVLSLKIKTLSLNSALTSSFLQYNTSLNFVFIIIWTEKTQLHVIKLTTGESDLGEEAPRPH